MTALGIAYLVIGALALVTAFGHGAQAVLIRSDPTPPAVAAASVGFFMYAVGFAATRGTVASNDPLLGLLGIGIGLTIICAFVPMVGWTLLELPLTRTRALIISVLVTVALARAADLVLHGTSEPEQTWFAVPAGIAAIAVSLVWTLDSLRSISSGTPYARAMAGFGLFAIAATTQGLLVTTRLIDAPDLFGFAGVPFIAFVNTLTTLRYVHALKHANQPAGDMSRYQVLEQLGSGGMGDVFLARRRGPAGFLRDVVLKTLKEATGDPSAHQRFLAEARLAAQLRHPNIVDVYDLGEQPGGFFIVMERIEGPTLGAVMDAGAGLQRPVPPEVVAEIGVQLCRALGFAHAAGVIHRDLKPQNVMLTFTGAAKLIDFGIAQQHSSTVERSAAPAAPSASPLTEGAGVVGTHGFISPERLYGETATPASDLFALGVVLYLLMTYQYPYPQKSSLDFIAAVRDRSAPRLHELRPDCPAPLVNAVEQCLLFDAAARPQSAAALEAQLELAVHGKRVDLAAFVQQLFPSGVAPSLSTAPTTPARDATTATANARAKARA